MKQPNHHALPIWQKILVLLCCWLGATLSAYAQGTGTIQGRVFNPVTKEYVRNAEVRLAGSNQVTYTENDGSFSIQNVPAGQATVNVQYTGYTPVTETFTVTAGQPSVREITMTSTAAAAAPAGKDGVVQLQAFTVASEREGNAKAIQAQRKDMNIITSVSSDIFGDVADGNVGEFLKYLPGVDLDYVESEPRGPRLGGMDGQYVGVSFDGMRSASADANRGGGAASRATSFEGFSITSIDSIEINRTASAENDADAPAGFINMKTKRAFDRKGRQVTYNFSANLNSEEFTFGKTDGPRDKQDRKWRPNYILTYAESFLNQKFGLLLSASHSYSYTEQITEGVGYNRTVVTGTGVGGPDLRPLVARQIDFKDGPKFIQKDALLLTADYKITPRLVLSLNMLYSYFDGEFWNRNFTFVAANDNANVNVANGRSTVGGDGVTTVIGTRDATRTVSNLTNGGGSSAKLSYTRQLSPRFEYRYGAWTADGAFAFSRAVNNYESLERGFSNNEGGSAPGGFIATRTSPKAWEWTIRQTSGNDWFDLRNFTNTNAYTGGTRATNDDRTWTTEKWTGTANVKWVVPGMERFPSTIKFGAKWDEETRKNQDHGAVSVWSYVGPGGNTVSVSPTLGTNINTAFGSWANLGPQFVSANPFETGTSNALTFFNVNGVQGMAPRVSRNAIAELMTAHPEQFVNTSNPENFFTSYINNDRNFRQTINAGYLQDDTRITSKLQIRVGLRAEQTKTSLTQFDPISRADVLAAGYTVNAPGTANGRALTIPGLMYQYMSKPKVVRKADYTEYFPSLLFKYNFLPNFEWQAGVNKAIGRPAIDDLTGLFTVNEGNSTINAPNANLAPEQHRNYQTRAAYYWQGRSPGQLSLAFALNTTTNTVVTKNYSASEFGIDDPDFLTYTVVSKANSPGISRTKNMSFGYNQTLGMLPSEYLRGLNVRFTYDRTYTSSNIRRLGVAPHRVSGGLGWNFRRFNTSWNVIWVDNKPNDSTYGRYFGQITKYDASIGFRISPQLQLFVQGRNITNVKDEWYESPPGLQEGKGGALRGMEEYGANWNFGIKGTF